MYPAMLPKRMDGDEPLVSPGGQSVAKLIDFWRWAYSDLVGNAERGALAEFIVACALGVTMSDRISWGKYDLLSREGIAVEVKTSGYLQTWDQKQLSRPIFGIQPTYGWDSKTNQYECIQKRQSDVYVFCLHKHTDQATINPLLISQWEFYLMPTNLLNEKFGRQRSVSLNSLIAAGAEFCEYDDLRERILTLVQRKNTKG